MINSHKRVCIVSLYPQVSCLNDTERERFVQVGEE